MAKKDWKKIFKKAAPSKGTDPLKMEIAPFRDWRIVVLGFFVGLAMSFGFNIYMSIEINRDSFFAGTTPNATEVSFDREGLAKVLDELAKKETMFEKTRTEGVSVADPSL